MWLLWTEVGFSFLHYCCLHSIKSGAAMLCVNIWPTAFSKQVIIHKTVKYALTGLLLDVSSPWIQISSFSYTGQKHKSLIHAFRNVRHDLIFCVAVFWSLTFYIDSQLWGKQQSTLSEVNRSHQHYTSTSNQEMWTIFTDIVLFIKESQVVKICQFVLL